ncbi:MAG: phage integrase SAM-like domain-containing protein [Candidatus Neomarinimicrobiota bacterium]
MASIYQIIPKKHRNPKGGIYKKYEGEKYKTYFQYSKKRADGKRYREIKYIGMDYCLQKDTNRYEKFLNDWKFSLQTTSTTEPIYFIRDLLVDFYKWNNKRVRQNELSHYTVLQTKTSLDNWLDWTTKKYGVLDINKTTWKMINEYDEYLRYDKKKFLGRNRVPYGIGLAPNTRSSYLSYIRTFLKWANRSNYLDNEVLLDILNKFEWPELRRIKEEDELYPQPDHQKEYISYLRKKVEELDYSTHQLGLSSQKPTWYYYVLLIQSLTGLRPSETLVMTWEKQKGNVEGGSKFWSYLDLDKDELSIYCKKKFRRIPINHIRRIIDRIPRKVGMGHHPETIKKHYLRNSFPKGYRRKKYREWNSTYLFENPYTKLPYSISRLHELHSELMGELKYPNYGLHSWRRAFITRMFHTDQNIARIADYVGHSSARTVDLYRKFRPIHLRPIIEEIKEW